MAFYRRTIVAAAVARQTVVATSGSRVLSRRAVRHFSYTPTAWTGPTPSESTSQGYIHKRVGRDKNVQSDNAREGLETRKAGAQTSAREGQVGLDAAQASSAGGGKNQAEKVFGADNPKKDNIGTFSQVGGMTDGSDSLQDSQAAGQTKPGEAREQESAPSSGSMLSSLAEKVGLGSGGNKKSFSTSTRTLSRKAEQDMEHHTESAAEDTAGHHAAGKDYSNLGSEGNTSKPREGLPSQDQSRLGSESRGQGIQTAGEDGRIEPFEASQEHIKVDASGHGRSASGQDPAGSTVFASSSTGKPNIVAAQQSTETQMPGQGGRPESVHGPDGSQKPGKKHINQQTGFNSQTTAPRTFSTFAGHSHHFSTSTSRSEGKGKPLGKSIAKEALTSNPSDPTQTGRAQKDAKHQSGLYSDDIDPDHMSGEGFGRKADAGELPNAARANIGYDDKLPNLPQHEVMGKKGNKKSSA